MRGPGGGVAEGQWWSVHYLELEVLPPLCHASCTVAGLHNYGVCTLCDSIEACIITVM